MTGGSYGFNASVLVTCNVLPETIKKWKIKTYEIICQAYYAMKRAYEEELAARSVRAGVQIEGQSPT